MKPEELLHLFSPYLPTDRFRALLRHSNLPVTSRGAALLVDISGFTPLTTKLVAEYGPERASEELKRRLNPMFEAVAGQVFHHGGSVIRFVGDGFISWFDDRPVEQETEGVPGVLRALAAGLEMQAVMPIFRGLRLKVCIGVGSGHRWVVGKPKYGLADILLGPAVDAMNSLAGEALPGQVMIHRDAVPWLRSEHVNMELTEVGNAIVLGMQDTTASAARGYRWPAWAAEGDIHQILEAVRPFVEATIRERVENDLGDFVAELRHALPVFIQISGIEPDTPQAQARLDQHVGEVQGVLANTGGRMVSAEVSDKGSILFAVFGAPVSYGDDAERAVRTMLTLRSMSTELSAITIQRVGVSRGLLYAGIVGGEVRHEYSIIGDETNIASRLMSAADSGQILVSSAVRKEIGPRIIFHDLPPVNVKGKSEPIPVSEPVAVQATSQARQSHVGQFVGREPELKQIQSLLDCVGQGLPRILRMEGQAGIGKSRLIGETVKLAVQQGFRAAGGDCISTERANPYLPWRDLLFSLLDLNLEASPEENVKRLSTFSHPGWAPRMPLLADLLDLPISDTPSTVSLDARTRRQALFALVIDLIVYLARKQPLLLVLEDIQWIDEVSDHLLIELAQRLNADFVPVMIILAHRPLLDNEEAPALIDSLSEMSIHNHLLMDELTRAEVIEMMERYLDANVPPELTRFVYERAHGNPLYIQEVIDALTETGHIRAVGSHVFVENDLHKADLPLTIQGLVQARIDRLNEMDKLVLKVAAVIGRQFQVRVLAKSIPVHMEYDEVLDRLKTLQAHDFSYLETSEPELTYLFKHAITQEVTYQSLLFAQRRQLHQAVATSLEVVAPDAIERLAYHFARSGDEGRARHYLRRAGEKAYHEYANQAALTYLSQALELTQDDDELFEISRQRMQIMLRSGDIQNIPSQLPMMYDLAERCGCIDWKAAVHILWASYYQQTSAWPQMINESQKAIAFARQASDDAQSWDAYLLLRSAFRSINQREEAEQITKMMEPIAARLADHRRSVALALLKIEDISSQAPGIAILGGVAAVAQAREMQDPVLEADCWSALAQCYSHENNLLAALDAYRQQINLLRQIGDRRHEGLTLNHIGITLINLGEVSEGNTQLLEAYRILHQIGERAGEATSLTHLGVIAYHHKAYEEALAWMDRGLAIQRFLNADVDAALTLFHAGNVYIAKGQPVEAARAWAEARDLLEANNLPYYVEEIDCALAEVDIQQGKGAAARVHIGALLPRLMQEQFNNLFLPELACWRVIQVLDFLHETEHARAMRHVFHTYARTILDRLSEEKRYNYINAVWYHTALLSDYS